jgi:hypothetical protein
MLETVSESSYAAVEDGRPKAIEYL